MDYTIAMSYNFVDEHNFEQHMQWRKSNPGTRAHPSRIAANQVCGPVAFDKSSLLSTAATGTYKRTCCEVHPFAARSYFPVNYTSHPNRADEPWSTFFRRQMPDFLRDFSKADYASSVKAAVFEMLVTDEIAPLAVTTSSKVRDLLCSEEQVDADSAIDVLEEMRQEQDKVVQFLADHDAHKARKDLSQI